MIKVMDTTGQRGGSRVLLLIMAVLAVLAIAYVGVVARRPMPAVTAAGDDTQAVATVPESGPLAWPAAGQAAVGIAGSPILETHGAQTPIPTASTAKLITALVVLQAKPLLPGQQGPTITLGPADIAIYNKYFLLDGSLVAVKSGEKISEYQMLEAMLLPSANNMADSLAIWAFGSLDAYSSAANQYLKDHGLTGTHVGSDASGLNPSTTSTAGDMVKIGELVMQVPVLAQIVGQSSASHIPVAGTVNNVNFLLGSDNIVGIKTGNNNQDGGAFVSASRIRLNGKSVTLVTALMGSPTLFQALKDSTPLIRSAQANFKPVTVVNAGIVAGRYVLPWGGSVSAQASQSLTLDGWAGSNIPFTVHLDPINGDSKTGQTVGTITVQKTAFNDKRTVPLKLSATPARPSLGWRLLHPFN